jgi:hypothetical protein
MWANERWRSSTPLHADRHGSIRVCAPARRRYQRANRFDRGPTTTPRAVESSIDGESGLEIVGLAESDLNIADRAPFPSDSPATKSARGFDDRTLRSIPWYAAVLGIQSELVDIGDAGR